MAYIYDILLNFNEDFFEFYDWNKNDKIIHIKKIPIYQVDNKTLKDILHNKIKINGDFLTLIKDKTEVFYKHEIGKIKYCCLLYNLGKIIAINIDKEGIINGFSDLLIDEYTELIETLDELKDIKINYEILENINDEEFKTRNEKLKDKFILKNIFKLNEEQLKYIYYEIFLDNCFDKNVIVNELIRCNDKNDLYNLIKCMLARYKKIK